MRDASRFPYLIVGADMNSTEIDQVAREAGYSWPTESIPRSSSFGRIDHVFIKGLATVAALFSGTVATAPGRSDHRPIWITVSRP